LRTAAEEAGSLIIERMADLANRSEQATRQARIWAGRAAFMLVLGAGSFAAAALLFR
jgi:hypothetical protein